MKKSHALLAFSLLIFFADCKKKTTNDNNTVKDCEKNNYGVVTVNFGATTHIHSILVTFPGTSISHEKIVPKGQSSDTLQLKPNSSAYPISISSLDSVGAAIDQSNKTATVSKCSAETFSVPF